MSSWKDSFISYFVKGSKPHSHATLGVEVEHFILESHTQKAVSYYGEKGVRQVLGKLMKLYPEAKILLDDDFFGFSTPQFTVTLEPAAQLEVSLAPMQSIRQIGSVYQHFLHNLDNVLSAFGYVAVTVGCQPTCHVGDLALLPKKRYALMGAYFQHCGTGGIEMMRGTSSVQISVDYESETDFRRKIQAAYFYSPLLKLLCDNSPSFQGKEVSTSLKRTDIWRRVDTARCGILPNIFSPSYSFADYTDFLGAMPPIFLKQGAHVVPTGQQTSAQLLENHAPTPQELSHILSMAFPDVRLKHVLEVRVADSVPLPFMLAYCALMKGLLYSQEGLDFAQTQIKKQNISEKTLVTAEDALMRQGWKACVYGRPVQTWAKDILALAKRNLPMHEQLFLETFYTVITYGGICHIPADIYCKLERKTTDTMEQSA